MIVREYDEKDLDTCIKILMDTFNAEPWNNEWTPESARRYLLEFTEFKRFVGYVAEEYGVVVGAAFCRCKVWYAGDELFVEELFIHPKFQSRGFGSRLISALEKYASDNNIGAVTLLTDRYVPAPKFYKAHGYEVADHTIFMYKDIK